MNPRWKILIAILLLNLAISVGVGSAATSEGSGKSFWGEIPPEDDENTTRFQDNKRPLWENLIYYPYQLVAKPASALTGSIGSTVAWASNPRVYRTVSDIVTLSFVPVEGRLGISAGGGDGIGASYDLTHNNFLGSDNRMKLSLGRSTEQKSKATLGFLFGDGHVNSLAAGIGYRLNPNSRYFGLGYASLEDNESYFTNETAWIGGAYRREFGDISFLEAEGVYSTAATRGSWGYPDESIERIFTPEEHPPGLGDQSDGYTFTLGLHRDSTGETGRPNRGGIRQYQVSLFTSTDDSDVKFFSQRFELQQFIPLWHTRRSLALRGIYSRLQSLGDDPIPFQRMLTNDDPDLLRGYRDLRFRDEGLVAFTAEYRFPTWNYRSTEGLGLDAFLFADLGQVFNHSNEIALRNLTESYGGGFRFLTRAGFSGRLEFGFSDEDMVIRLGAQQTFQYGKGGLHNGHNPIPSR